MTPQAVHLIAGRFQEKKKGCDSSPKTLVTGRACQLTHGVSEIEARQQTAPLTGNEAVFADEAAGDRIFQHAAAGLLARHIHTAIAIAARDEARNGVILVG